MREKLQANRGFTYAGKALVAGDKFEATRQDARVLRAVGRASPVAQDAYVAPAAPVGVTKDKTDAPQTAQAPKADTAPVRGKPGPKPKAGPAR